ncbi:hypothetical protein [Christiangramia forsetii]|uniref:Uncharacterized protein n=1 Tax=Christiangramia forsetii TaxID=411153 RepID=A0ABQ1WUC9_9FLAO|nr:hypothetical protein [Christiangramia forsetii]GGG45468.1 hypothetical protein GCM10011532_31830 [Christiangramia forsetii]
MSDDTNKQADWQKNAGRPSNFHEKDDNLKKDGDGNLKIKKQQNEVSKEENEAIKDTLDSLSDDEE